MHEWRHVQQHRVLPGEAEAPADQHEADRSTPASTAPFQPFAPSRATCRRRQSSAKMRSEWMPRKISSPRTSMVMAGNPAGSAGPSIGATRATSQTVMGWTAIASATAPSRGSRRGRGVGRGQPCIARVQRALGGVDDAAGAIDQHGRRIRRMDARSPTRRASIPPTHAPATQHQVEVAGGAAGQRHLHRRLAGKGERRERRGQRMRVVHCRGSS